MNYSKIAIKNSFWELLEERPYNKITVNDIVDRCGLNRNTFYYHFKNIPDLLTSILESAAEEAMKKNRPFDTSLDCISPIVDLVRKNQRPIMHIYNSLQREIFLRRLDMLALQIAEEYIDNISQGMDLVEEDKEFIVRFQKCVIVGVCLDWFRSGLSYDLSFYLERYFHTAKKLNNLF